MSDQEYMNVFSKNLKYYMNQYELTNAELAKRLGVSAQSVSYWTTAQKAPRIDKVDAMCKMFNCKRSDLMEEHTNDSGYYIDPRTAEIAQEIKDSKELSALFDVGRDMKPEDLQTVYQMALALKLKEQG